MPLNTPFRLGPFVVDAHGRLQPGESNCFPSFRLAWRDCQVRARLSDGDGGDGAARLALSAVLGRVPSTAGGNAAHNQKRRSRTFGALDDLKADVSEAAGLRLLPDHRFAMEASRNIVLPVSVVDLLTEITCFLLDVGPYLDLLAEAEVPVEPVGAEPSRNGGMAKI